MNIGDFVALEAEKGDECPEEPGVIVGYVVHYPKFPPHLGFKNEVRRLEPQEVPDALRSKATALINGAQGVFEEALAEQVRPLREQVRPLSEQVVALQQKIDELLHKLDGWG